MSGFEEISADKVLLKSDYFFVIADKFPVSPGHMLIISNEIRKDFWSLTAQEKLALTKTIEEVKILIERKYQPDGYNIGMNCGKAAGQTVFHFHCHVIPRYNGDMKNPRGGVRHCVSGKGDYTVE
jgi:diadenosine tetraphosphate (Ap4A) HIT family hydrolase